MRNVEGRKLEGASLAFAMGAITRSVHRLHTALGKGNAMWVACFACRCRDALNTCEYGPNAYCARCDAFTDMNTDDAFRLASFGIRACVDVDFPDVDFPEER